MALFKNRFCLFFLGLALVFSTGCGGGGGGGSSQLPGNTAGTTTLSGSLMLTDPADAGSLRAAAAPTKAEISLSYLTTGGIEVPLKTGIVAQITDNKANYEFNFDYDAAASTRRNFMLKAMLDNGEIIEGVIPMNPGDKKIKAPPITPLDTGMARFIKEAAIKGNPDVSVGDLMSMFPPKVLFGLSDADLQSLAAEFVNRETKMQTISAQFGGEVAGKMAQLREFGYEAARDTREYMAKYPEMVNPTEMRERYEDMMRNRAQALGLPPEALKAIEAIDLQLVQGVGERADGMTTLPPDFIADFNGMGLVTEARSRMEMLSQTLKVFVTWSDIQELVDAFDLALTHMYGVVRDEKPENLDAFMYVDPAIMIFEKARFIIFRDLGLLEKSPDSPPLIFALLPRPEDFGPISNQPPVDFNDDSVWILPYPGKDSQSFAAAKRSRLNAMMIQIGDPAGIVDFQKQLMSNLIERINKNFDLLKFSSTAPTGDTRARFVEALAVLLAEPMDPTVYGFDPGYNPGEPGSEPGWEGPEPIEPIFERYQELYGTLIKLEPAKIRNGVTYEYALTGCKDSDGTTSDTGWVDHYQAYIYDNNIELEQFVGVTGVFVLKFLSEPLAGPNSDMPEAPGFTYVKHRIDPEQ